MSTRRRTTFRIVSGLLSVVAITSAIAVVAVLMSRGAGDTGSGPVDGTRAGETVVAFYGDSYTRGTMASAPDKRWSSIISAERGWTEFNPSRNGLGFVNNRGAMGGADLVDQVIADHPDIVISTMGLNDNFSMPARADEIKAAITRDFTKLKAALPEALFIIVEPFWYTEERPESVDRINGWVQAAAAGIGADYIPGASHWLDGHPEWMAVDGLHPNDEGYQAIANRMDAALATLGL
ncbi:MULTISPECIES: SGNH/GDSL hydrolase family protein [Cryobacterium]|nr:MULTISPECIES: SGNH/GDSL hydrolase family protein [Cryobacterium]